MRLLTMVCLIGGFGLFAPISGVATEPIAPLPRVVEYDRAKALLGKRLFFDTRLSSDGTVSCASCHNGVNIGGNSFQYLGAVMPFTRSTAAGDLFAISGDPFDLNRFKVPPANDHRAA